MENLGNTLQSGSQPKLIDVTGLFPILDQKLTDVLRSLSDAEWKVLATPKWTVKDVAGHLLDSSLRRLSMARDGYWGEAFTGSSKDELHQFLNGLNADWVRAMRRISPKVLIGLLEESGRELNEYLASLDPQGVAAFAVSWAGEERSQNWFDVAREYTERWHHQQQIRESVNRDVEAISSRELYHPVLETFMHALPYAYRAIPASEGMTFAVSVEGAAGGDWHIRRSGERWILAKGSVENPDARVLIPQRLAWRLFTKSLPESEANAHLVRSGDPGLTSQMTKVVAIVG